jgi:site-specific DNA-methyltransferase (cytosine-N4-specific)
MRAVFAEVRRVLADDGTLWLNIGDSYREKALVGAPWRVAFALVDDGWLLRNEVVWSKPCGLPAPVADRFTTTHEHVFLLTKRASYSFNLDSVREPHSEASVRAQEIARKRPHNTDRASVANVPGARAQTKMSAGLRELNAKGKNPGTVWIMAPQQFTEAHFAVMPQALAERAILAGCKPGGTVLDPFSGSGTTGYAANKHGRKYVGIDLSSDYLDLSLRTRFAQPGLDLSGEAS